MARFISRAMTVEAGIRGDQLVSGGRALELVPHGIGGLWAGSLNKLLDRIDSGLAAGSVELTLPDGAVRLLGGRAAGFAAKARLHDWRALLRLATAGSVGCYQGWEAGEWSSPDEVELFALFCANALTLGDAARARGPWRWMGKALHWLHRNTRQGAARNIHAHYDLGNDFYAAWLGRSMVYSSARFDRGASNLEDAQMDKIAAIVGRLQSDGRALGRVLEIGCGWGALAARLAEQGGKSAVKAISLSEQQLAFARQRYPQVDFVRQDYRDVPGQFDSIASVEMVEAVGRTYWPDFFDVIARLLAPGGRAAIQYISIREELFEAYAAGADFIQTYIFPGGMLVSEAEFRRLAAQRGLEWRDQESFGPDYAETLRLWRDNFDHAAIEGRLPAGFDSRFERLWRFYLMYCEGGFRGGLIDVGQVTLVKPG